MMREQFERGLAALAAYNVVNRDGLTDEALDLLCSSLGADPATVQAMRMALRLLLGAASLGDDPDAAELHEFLEEWWEARRETIHNRQ